MIRRLIITVAVLLSGFVVAGETGIEFVYFGGAGCGFCKNPDLRSTIPKAIKAIEQESKRRGWSFETIAVSVDESQEQGRTFLKTYCSEFDIHVCDGKGFKTDLFQKLIMNKPARQEGVDAQVEGIPCLVVTKNNEMRVVLARHLSGTILPFLKWVSDADPVRREQAFACLFDQQCPGVALERPIR